MTVFLVCDVDEDEDEDEDRTLCGTVGAASQWSSALPPPLCLHQTVAVLIVV